MVVAVPRLLRITGVEEAVRDAQDFTWQSLKNGFRGGMGQFIPDRMFWARDDEADADKGKGDEPA